MSPVYCLRASVEFIEVLRDISQLEGPQDPPWKAIKLPCFPNILGVVKRGTVVDVVPRSTAESLIERRFSNSTRIYTDESVRRGVRSCTVFLFSSDFGHKWDDKLSSLTPSATEELSAIIVALDSLTTQPAHDIATLSNSLAAVLRLAHPATTDPATSLVHRHAFELV